MYLWNDRGDRLIDASSGLFCVNAGHGRKEIAEAVGTQLRELDFIAPFTRGHPKQFELATRVAELTPGDLNRIFFVNSGSEAVDTAMKVALAYHQARGQGGRNVFVSRERAYHGVNFGGVSLSGLVNNRRKFGPALPGIAHMRHTHLKENFFTPGEGAHGADLAEDLVRFVEPVRRREHRRVLRRADRRLDRLPGAAEGLPRSACARSATRTASCWCSTRSSRGFGRTGQTFAAQSFGVTPDLMTMAKGITNGAQPMGAVAVSERIHDTIIGAAPEGAIEFFHGYTYSGHPASCAAGLATLDIYRNEGLFERGARAVAVLPRRAVLAEGPAGRRRHPRLRDDGGDRRAPRRRARQARPRSSRRSCSTTGLQPQDDRRRGDHRAAARSPRSKHVDEIADILRKTLAAL